MFRSVGALNFPTSVGLLGKFEDARRSVRDRRAGPEHCRARCCEIRSAVRFAFGNRGVGEIESAMAAETGQALVEEEDFASLGGIGNRAVVAVIVIAIIGRTRRDDAPFEAGESLGNVARS